MKAKHLTRDVHKTVHWRWHPILNVWILNSPHRLKRAWAGAKSVAGITLPEYHPECPFCPGNKRANGEINPQNPDAYPFVFTNDCQALLPPRGKSKSPAFVESFYKAIPVNGTCRVVNFHPKHNLTFSLMSEEECLQVVWLWQKEYRELGRRPYISTVNIFENNRFGSSMPHPHNQIWCSSEVSPYLMQIIAALKKHKAQSGACLFCQTIDEETSQQKRVIYENDGFVAFVPYWAIWPFEIWIVSRKHIKSIADLDQTGLENLALAYKIVNMKLDNLFNAACPYSSGVYQEPTDGKKHPEMHLHIVFRPPVVRSVDVWKWMVGYEFMAQPQRDITPEKAAEFLKATPDSHYSRKH